MIILHGLGADGSDFVPVAHELDLGPVGPVRFVFPHAPVRPVTINNGYVMPAWYDILSLDAQNRREDEAGLRQSQALVEALIAREKARGIPARRIVLAGFSQGCAMTLMTGPAPCRAPGRPGVHVGLPAARGPSRGRAPCQQPRRADLHGPRHARSGDRDRPGAGVARCPGPARPSGRVARVPDAALGLRRGDRGPPGVAAPRPRLDRRRESLSAAARWASPPAGRSGARACRRARRAASPSAG